MSEVNTTSIAITLDELVKLEPIHFMDMDADQLRVALDIVKGQLKKQLNRDDRRFFEEQFCYIMRELEVRPGSGFSPRDIH